MTTKEKLLALLAAEKGTYFSGEEIAQTLSLSRTAVWKAVKGLKSEGYSIDAVNNRGYCLSSGTDILSQPGIANHLCPANRKISISIVQTADSTNSLVREKACAGFPEGYTLISNEQTAGRGRLGRSFYSPPNTGIYFSILLRPVCYTAFHAARITTMAAVAMCQAIEEISTQKPQIKWVNDIYIKGKKVCGILTEGSFGMESGMLEYAVLGVGVNLYPPQGGFPDGLEKIAGTIFEKQKDECKNRLIASFINHFMLYYQEKCDFVGQYRSYSLVIGKQITVVRGADSRKALAYGIDDECRLIVRYDDGTTESLACGEIKIKI